MIYQDPYSSLNPRIRVGDAVAEPARVHGLIEKGDEERYATELLDRVGIAQGERAAATRTSSRAASASGSPSRARSRVSRELLIADEAVSALDVSIQAQLLPCSRRSAATSG